MATLKFSEANDKTARLARRLGIPVAHLKGFSIPAGWTCANGLECMARADRVTGAITDGPQQKFRCYAASLESRFPDLRAMVWHNLDILKVERTAEGIAKLIMSAIPKRTRVIRLHVAGELYRREYYDAWCIVAKARPDIVIYGYTKHLCYATDASRPSNFRLVYSLGGRPADDLTAIQTGIVYSRVVGSEAEAEALGLPVNVDDFPAFECKRPFALVIHGPQPRRTGKAGKTGKA